MYSVTSSSITGSSPDMLVYMIIGVSGKLGLKGFVLTELLD